MAKIAKTYKALWYDGATLEASDTRRALDDAYDFVNCSVNFGNFNNLTIDYTDLDMTTNFWTSTGLAGVLTELEHPGYHSLHFFTLGTGIDIFPGRIMINQKMNYVNSRLNISACEHLLCGAGILGGKILLIGQGLSGVITASDVFLTDGNNISASLAWNNDKQGYYPAIASGTKRAIIDVQVSFFVGFNDFWDPPWTNFFYALTNSEMSAASFLQFTTSVVSSVYYIYDSRQRSYYYDARGFVTSATGAHHIASFDPSYFRANGMHAVKDNTVPPRVTLIAPNVWDSDSLIAGSLLYSDQDSDIRYYAFTTANTSFYFNTNIVRTTSGFEAKIPVRG